MRELGSDLATTALSLACRFHDGATLLCLAPAWPEHAPVEPPIDTVRHVLDETRRP
jgi:hypothetical protein